MKFLFYITFCLFNTSLYSQSWQWQNPIPTSSNYHSINFVDANTGYTVTDNAKIFKTTDGGASWDSVYSGEPYTIWSIRFVSPLTGWLAGHGGLIMKTEDGGYNWKIQRSNTNSILRKIYFINSSTGWAIGHDGVIVKTTDAGSNWTPQVSQTNNVLHAIHFVSPLTGWISGAYDAIIHTTNGGTNWVAQNAGTTHIYFYALYFPNAMTGYIAGSFYTICKTTNGGNNWQIIADSNRLSGYGALYFSSPDSGWTFASGGSITRTTNGGLSWIALPPLAEYGFVEASFTSPNIGYAAGTGGLVVKTSDGENWHTITKNVTKNFLDGVYFLNNKTGWAGGANSTIVHTTNGGLLWTAQTDIPVADRFKSFIFINPDVGWVRGDQYLLKTNNAGSSWNLVSTMRGDVSFVDELTGWLSNDKVYKTTNGGFNWTMINDSIRVYRNLFINSNTGWAISSKIYLTTNGGMNWSLQYAASDSLLSINFISESTGWISGGGGLVLRTTNAGANWYSSVIKGGGYLKKIQFVDNMIGWARGSSPNVIFRSVDGGVSWNENPTNFPIYDFHFASPDTGWGVGVSGSILRTTNGGILTSLNYNEFVVESDFYLYQNYPNPFNSSTRISYRLPSRTSVSIKIYDISGREISTVINKTQDAGNYSLSWNAENLASGIYFYRLSTEDFLETRRMILVK